MKNVKMTIWLLIISWVCFFNLPKAMGTLYDDGLTHNIITNFYNQIEIRDSFFGGVTKLNLLPGGLIYDVKVYDNSLLDVSGGESNNGIEAYNSSKVYISSGGIPSYHSLKAYDSSSVYMTGGGIGYETATGSGILYAYDNSNVYISGGYINGGVRAFSGSTVTFIGADFIFGGVSVNYGEYDTNGQDSVQAPISWSLPNGDTFSYNVIFYEGATVVLAEVPEPATLLLFSLGGLFLRKRR